MGWVNVALEALQRGETVQIRPHGHSMRGKVNDGDWVTLAPCDPETLSVDDVVLVKVKGNYFLHLIKDIQHGRFLIGNNLGKLNGWVEPDCIFGVATQIVSK